MTTRPLAVVSPAAVILYPVEIRAAGAQRSPEILNWNAKTRAYNLGVIR